MIERIYIIGQSGVGKTSFASQLSQKLHYPHINLDTLWHKHHSNKQAFKHDVLEAIEDTKWIVEGKHQTTRKELIKRADLIIYLDFPFRESIINNIQRALRNKEPLFKFLMHLFKVIKQFYLVKRDLKEELSSYKHKLKILKSREELNIYLRNWIQDTLRVN